MTIEVWKRPRWVHCSIPYVLFILWEVALRLMLSSRSEIWDTDRFEGQDQVRRLQSVQWLTAKNILTYTVFHPMTSWRQGFSWTSWVWSDRAKWVKIDYKPDQCLKLMSICYVYVVWQWVFLAFLNDVSVWKHYPRILLSYVSFMEAKELKGIIIKACCINKAWTTHPSSLEVVPDNTVHSSARFVQSTISALVSHVEEEDNAMYMGILDLIILTYSSVLDFGS